MKLNYLAATNLGSWVLRVVSRASTMQSVIQALVGVFVRLQKLAIKVPLLVAPVQTLNSQTPGKTAEMFVGAFRLKPSGPFVLI